MSWFSPSAWRKWWSPTNKVVHHLRLKGSIADARGPNLSLRSLEKSLAAAFDKKKNERLAAVAISINSPGGSPVQSSLIYGRIRALAEENEVPVFTFAEDVAASGGFWLLTAGDVGRVYADPASLVGSIGVVTGGFGMVGLIEKLGVERRLLHAGKSKARSDPFSPVKEEDLAKTKEILSDMHVLFEDHVRGSRGGKLAEERAEDIFSGDVWLGKEAKDLGLVDDLGTMRSVIRKEYGEEVEIKEVKAGPEVPWPFSTLTGSMGAVSTMGIGGFGSAGGGEQRIDLRVGEVSATIPASAVGAVAEALEERATEHALGARYRMW